MQIEITKLRSGIVQQISIKETKVFTKEELEDTPFISLDEIQIEGIIVKGSMDEYLLDCVVTGKMVLPCVITLKPVIHPFSITISGNIEEMLEEIGKIDKKVENTIDIFPIIWENILVEIPTRVISKDAEKLSLKGDGWCLCTEEQKETINPELQKLSDLLK